MQLGGVPRRDIPNATVHRSFRFAGLALLVAPRLQRQRYVVHQHDDGRNVTRWGTSNKPKLGGGSSTKTPAKDAGTTKPPAPQPETQTCKGAALCGDACADDDFACEDKCTDNMSDAEREKMKQVWLCIGNSGCNDDACVQEACAAEIAACIGD